MPPFKLIQGNCIEVMRNARENSIDSIVADAPYALSFMGLDFDKPAEMLGTAIGISGGFTKFPPGVKRPEIKRNDPHAFQEWCRLWGLEAMRVMKPGAYGICFGATRTYHRLASGLEDAGFEIRDTLMYLHGQGMPKGLNVSKKIDAIMGAERKVVATVPDAGMSEWNQYRHGQYEVETMEITEHGSDEAKQWDGWNTQLKPAVEPIVLFQKPVEGTIAENVLKWGVGALNIDACRIGTSGSRNNGRQADSPIYGAMGTSEKVDYDRGRHPANVILDDAAAEMLGEPHRYFYRAKPSRTEKLAGVPEDLAVKIHPTTKGIELCRYFARLVTPPNGTILDPFLGSGTTGCAAMLEGFKFVGIEMSEEYMPLAQARITHWNAVAEAGE